METTPAAPYQVVGLVMGPSAGTERPGGRGSEREGRFYSIGFGFSLLIMTKFIMPARPS